MNSSPDEIDFDYATTIADRANSLMAQHRVPPTPDNFSVWFSYAMGGSLALKKTVDILTSGNSIPSSTTTFTSPISSRIRISARAGISPSNCTA